MEREPDREIDGSGCEPTESRGEPVSDETTTIRLLFVDDGAYHHETVQIPAESLGRYDRLIDCLREDPAVLERLHVDVERLCSATVMDADGDDEEAGED